MKAIKSFGDALSKISSALCGASVLFILLLILVQVFFRYILKMSLGGAEELPTYVMAICCWISVPVAALEDNHLNIDLIPNMFRGRSRIIWTIWAELIEVLAMSYFTVLAWKYMSHVFRNGQVTGGLGLPIWIFYAVIVYGAGFCALFGLLNLVKNLIRIVLWKNEEGH
jgi:TRAP-type C4-dicarboxylate transport system permease small subunit